LAVEAEGAWGAFVTFADVAVADFLLVVVDWAAA